MKKPDIAKRLAKHAGVSRGEAADSLDRIVRQILCDLRHGKDAPLPGLGRFVPGPDGQLRFEPEGERRDR